MKFDRMKLAESTIIMARSAYEQLIKVCTDDYPAEACGVLAAGTSSSNGASIDHVIPVRNAAERPAASFVFDPHDWVRVYADMRRSRQMIAGFYHSHPHAAPVPSAADADGLHSFGGEGMTYCIVSFAGGSDIPPAVAAYRMARNKDGKLMLAQIRIQIA